MIDLTKDLVVTLEPYNGLRCDKCKREIKISDTAKARYFATGWPECCGYTMGLARLAAAGGGE